MASRRANTSRHAILGVLSLCPMSGYDVKKLIERSIAHFWNESYGQIYPILNRLAAEGFAERRRETQRGKPDRHVYSLTDKGRAELRRWLAIPARHEPVRSELLLKLFLGVAGPVTDSIAQIEHYQARQTGAPRDVSGHRAAARQGDGGPSAASVLARDPSSRSASLPRDSRVVRRDAARPAAPAGAARPPAALRRSNHGKPDGGASIASHRGRHDRAGRRAGGDAHRQGRPGPPPVGQDLLLVDGAGGGDGGGAEPLAPPDLPHAARRLQLLPGVRGLPRPLAQAPGAGRTGRARSTGPPRS